MSVVWTGGQQPSWMGTPQSPFDPTAETQGRYQQATTAAQAQAQLDAALGAAYAQQGYNYTPSRAGVGFGPNAKITAPSMQRIETAQDRQLALANKQFELKKGVLNSLSGLLASFGTGKSGAGAPEITAGPEFTPSPVYSKEQMIAQQNLIRDRSMQQAAGISKRATAKAGASGFAGNSPLLKALQANMELGGRVAGEQGALDFSRQADTANAQNMLAGSQLAQERHNAYQQALLQRYQAQLNDRNALVSVLASLAG